MLIVATLFFGARGMMFASSWCITRLMQSRKVRGW